MNSQAVDNTDEGSRTVQSNDTRSSQTVKIMETGNCVVQNTEARSSQVVDNILSQEAMQCKLLRQGEGIQRRILRQKAWQ